MPSVVHELLLEVFRETPALAEVLRLAQGLRVGAMAPSDPNMAEVKPVEWRGDAFFVAGDPKKPRRWLILEVQTSVDREKLRTIPMSLELARERHRGASGDVVLVTAGADVARWFDRHPFRYEGPLGTRRTLSVVRVDLTRLPLKKLLDAKRPHLALLAVAAHRKDPHDKALRVASRACELAAGRRSALRTAIADAILQMVDARLRRELEEVMQREGYRTDWLQDAFVKGKAEGAAEAVREALLRVIAKRGFALSPEMKARIDAQTDLQRLERWLEIAVTAASVAEVFTDS
jgi:hypothetical protein